jgi:hypothetical protein
VFTADEGDHYVGGQSTPVNCDGITIACTYSKIGVFTTNMAGLLAHQTGIKTTFSVHADAAPTVYITGNPARDTNITRNFERAVSNLTAVNPITNRTDTLTKFLADRIEMKLLHMITPDPARTPTFTLFADPNYYIFAGPTSCNSACVKEDPSFAWNHGDIQPEITTTWLGIVGPGIEKSGIDNNTWSDHADIRPTMMLLLGLHDDYQYDGVALIGNLSDYTIPKSIKESSGGITLFNMAVKNYKQINAPVGQLAIDTLKASTKGIKSGNLTNDMTYNSFENKISILTIERDKLVQQVSQILKETEFNGKPLDQEQIQSLTIEMQNLLNLGRVVADS